MAMLAGMAVFLIVIPLNGYLMKLIEKADENRMDEKDKRIKLMNEILNGIKVKHLIIKIFGQSCMFMLATVVSVK